MGIAKSYFFSPPLDFYHECKEGRSIFSTRQRHRGSTGEGCTLKFGRYFSLAGIAKNFLLSSPLYLYHEFKEGSWIFSTCERHWGSPGEGCTHKFGHYFSLVGIAMSYLFSPTLDFSHECKEGSLIFFHITATSGLIRGRVHPKIWALFFLGGHCHELFFMPHIGFFRQV